MTNEDDSRLEKPARDLLFHVRLMCAHFLATSQGFDHTDSTREQIMQFYMDQLAGFSVVLPALVVASETLGLALDPPRGGLN
jgi:hypothetical protein